MWRGKDYDNRKLRYRFGKRTYPINPSGTGVKADTMDRMDEVRSFIRDNIDYEGLLQCHPAEKMDMGFLGEFRMAIKR